VSEKTVETLLSLAAERFGRDRGALAATDDFFDALEIDSVDAMTLLTAVEERFGVEIPDYEVQDVRTFAALADVIERRL
jgi:acyl carrier protein